MIASRFCAGLLLMGAMGSANSAGLPVSLEDPVSGTEIVLRAGAPALHIVFFATWCPPCVEELDRLAEIEARWEERGYRLVLVAVKTRHTAERLASFAAQGKPPGELLFDADGRAARALGSEHLPTHFLLDGAGEEVHRAASLDDGVIDALENLMWELERAPERER
jgi:thiol-disulfide isomerase/thioredoxin